MEFYSQISHMLVGNRLREKWLSSLYIKNENIGMWKISEISHCFWDMLGMQIDFVSVFLNHYQIYPENEKWKWFSEKILHFCLKYEKGSLFLWSSSICLISVTPSPSIPTEDTSRNLWISPVGTSFAILTEWMRSLWVLIVDKDKATRWQ